jgi:hypothetical protein
MEREVVVKPNLGRWAIRRRARILHNRVLYSEGEYREIARSGPTVELEVVSAPGLAAGTHLNVTAEAARATRQSLRAARVAGRFVTGHTPRIKLPTA